MLLMDNAIARAYHFSSIQMSAMKQANKELKGMMKTVNISDVDV